MKSKIPLITIGLDLGDKKHAICVLNQDGEIIDERTITNHRESLRRLSQKHPGARIAFEVGSHSPWIKRFLAELGHEVFVANPRKLRAIYTSDRKSDKNDARMLAKIARMDPQLLYLRRLLVGCAQYILGPFGPDTDLKRHGLMLAERGGGRNKRKAVVAVARKLAVLMLTLWKHGRDYEPLRGAEPAQAA